MEQLKEMITLFGTFVLLGGSLVLGWGLVSTGLSVKEKDGQGINNGILTMVGGGMVIAGGAFFISLGR